MNKLTLTICLIIAFSSPSAAQLPAYLPTDGLVGWWPFNGNANDESGNGYDGEEFGASYSSDRFGFENKAIALDGVDDYVFIGDYSSFNLDTFSISLWYFEVSIPTPVYAAHTMISKSTSNSGEIGYRIDTSGDGTDYFVQSQLGFPVPGSGFVNFPPTVLDNWTFVTVVKSGANVTGYKNGEPIGSNTELSALISNNSPLLFGAVTDQNLIGGFFDGKLDDIGMWNRALTDEEIHNLYSANLCFETITVTDTLIINMGITGFSPVTYSNTIKIFPNPTNDHITIHYGDFNQLIDYELRIVNSLGQVVFETAITQQSDYLNLASWGGNGLYFVQVIDPQGNFLDIRKIVLQ